MVSPITREDGTEFWSVTLDEDEISGIISVLDFGPRGFAVLQESEGEYSLIVPAPDRDRLEEALVIVYPEDEIVFLPRQEESQPDPSTPDAPQCGVCGADAPHSHWDYFGAEPEAVFLPRLAKLMNEEPPWGNLDDVEELHTVEPEVKSWRRKPITDDNYTDL